MFAELVQFFESEGSFYEYFKLMYPSQLFIGLIEAINHFPVASAAHDKLVYIDEDRGRVNILLNCN